MHIEGGDIEQVHEIQSYINLIQAKRSNSIFVISPV